MKPREQTQIEEELGQWENQIELADHALRLKLERSNSDIELLLPNPEKEVTLIARPNGFQLMSHHNNMIRKDFAITSSSIDSIQLLPSFTIENNPGINFKYILFSTVIIGVLGFSPSGELNFMWIIAGIIFGMVLSLFKKTYRQNLLMKINDNTDDLTLLFTINKRQKKDCIEFFSRFSREKFSA